MNNTPLPTFIIAGAAKSGTTSLYMALEQHPDVFVPYLKEPCYFSDGWHYTVNTWEKYVQLFADPGGARAIGEASVQYMADAETPRKIVERLGKIKILFTLRNPVDRAYSQWGQSRYHGGFETLTFEEALRQESTRHTPELKKKRYYHPQVFKYFERGLYPRYIERYLDVFGPENVKVIIFEEFVREPLGICRDVFGLLGVDPGFVPEVGRHNAAHQPHFKPLNFLFVYPPKWIENLYANSPVFMRKGVYILARTIHRANHSRPRTSPPLDARLRSELLEKYMPSIRELEHMLGRSLSLWYEKPAQRVQATS